MDAAIFDRNFILPPLYFVEFAAVSPVWLLGLSRGGADTPSHTPPRAFKRTMVATMRCPLICVAKRSIDNFLSSTRPHTRYPTRPALYLFMAISSARLAPSTAS